MEFGGNLTDLAFTVMVGIAVGGMAIAILYPFFSGSAASKRVSQVAENRRDSKPTGLRARLAEDSKDARRSKIQESLKQLENEEKKRKKKVTLRVLIDQSGLDMTVKTYWMMAAIVGGLFFIIPFFLGAPWFVYLGTTFVGFFGFPRWFLGYLRNRRQNKFLNDFADAIDVMVRGLKAGLPVSEAMKIIASESAPPVGPEFSEVVEGQRVGISIDQGIERMTDRMPLAEVNFLAIVMTIQSKTGGNLSEALGNLSRVLRDRKRMKQKIRSVSQEAKSSAAIIGSLPFIIMGALLVLNPSYLNPLFETSLGNMMLVGSATWMTMGVLVMRKMINFDF
jgi:tight adherence protein B